MIKEGGSAAIWIAAIGMISTLASGIIGYKSGSNAVDKDYVQIATGLLQRNDASPELRAWSAKVLEKLSPVPFGAKLKGELASQGFVVTRFIEPGPIPMTDSAALCPDLLKQYPDPNKLSWEMLLRAYQDCRINHENFVDYIRKVNVRPVGSVGKVKVLDSVR